VQLQKLAALTPARLLLSCRKEQGLALDDAATETVYDPPDNPGPLGAIIICLETVKLPLLVLAVDMPGMTVEFLQTMLPANEDQGVVCRSSHGFEPLAALYVPSALPLLHRQMNAGNFRMQAALGLLVDAGLMRLRELREDEVLLFRNANTPEEYAAWKTVAPPASP
jgi:molybdopterin-guanine dinucleotide biosynthesis protein A